MEQGITIATDKRRYNYIWFVGPLQGTSDKPIGNQTLSILTNLMVSCKQKSDMVMYVDFYFSRLILLVYMCLNTFMVNMARRKKIILNPNNRKSDG